jgi:uncharacterized membrane protein (DUF2068 family)
MTAPHDTDASRPDHAAARPAARQAPDRALFWIALFKLVKGTLLIAVAIGALKLLHRDVAETLASLVQSLRADPDNRFIHQGLVKLSGLNDHKLQEISLGSFFYAALLLTEGVGLLLRKRWAEYFTVIITASLMPLEIYELVEKFTATRVVVLILNAVIVGYLIVRLRRKGAEHHLVRGPSHATPQAADSSSGPTAGQ